MIEFILRFKRFFLLCFTVITLTAIYGTSRLHFDSFDGISLPPSNPAIQANTLLGDRFGGVESASFLIESQNILNESDFITLERISHEVEGLPGVRSPNDVLSPSHLKSASTGSNFLISSDKKAALIIASLGSRAYPDPIFSDRKLAAKHGEKIREISSQFSTGHLKVYGTSPLLISEIIRTETRYELFLVCAVALVLLILVFFFNSPTLFGVLVPTSAIFLSVLWTLGLMGFLNVPLRIASIYVIVVIMAVGSSYPIHAMAHFQEELSKPEHPRVSIHSAWLRYSTSILTVAIAAAMSAVSLLAFDVSDIRELGMFQAVGITLAALFTIFIIPALTLYFPRPLSLKLNTDPNSESSAIRHRRLTGLLVNISAQPIHYPILSLLLVIAVTAGSFIGIKKVVADFNLAETIPRSSEAYQGYKKIQEKFGLFHTLSLVIRSDTQRPITSSDGLEILTKVRQQLDAMEGVDVLPGLDTLVSRLNQEFFGDVGIPRSSSRVQQLLFLTDPISTQRVLDWQNRSTVMSLLVREIDREKTLKTIQGIEQVAQEVPKGFTAKIGGAKIMYLAMNQYMVKNKIESIFLCLAIVFVLCILINASVTQGLITLAPAALAGAMTFAAMGFFRINLDFATATITTIAIGVGVDFAIHYLLKMRSVMHVLSFRNRGKKLSGAEHYQQVILETTKSYGKTIVFDALSNILGFCPLLLSAFPPLRTSGILLVYNQIIVVLATFFVLPLLVFLIKPKLLVMNQSTLGET